MACLPAAHLSAQEARSANPDQQIVEFTDGDGLPSAANEGWVTLAWEPAFPVGPDSGIRYELQQGVSASFENALVRYEGPDMGTFVSGLPEGDHYFRVRAVFEDGRRGPWSTEPRIVRVDFVSHTLVYSLMTVGLVVFVATVSGIVSGHLKEQRKTDGVQA